MAKNPYQPPPEEATAQLAPPITLRWSPILHSAAAWFVAYLAGIETRPGSSIMAFALLLAIISSIWIYYDAKRVGLKLVGATRFLIFFCWMLAVPIYLIYTRKRIGWGWAILQVIATCSAWYAGWRLHH